MPPKKKKTKSLQVNFYPSSLEKTSNDDVIPNNKIILKEPTFTAQSRMNAIMQLAKEKNDVELKKYIGDISTKQSGEDVISWLVKEGSNEAAKHLITFFDGNIDSAMLTAGKMGNMDLVKEYLDLGGNLHTAAQGIAYAFGINDKRIEELRELAAPSNYINGDSLGLGAALAGKQKDVAELLRKAPTPYMQRKFLVHAMRCALVNKDVELSFHYYEKLSSQSLTAARKALMGIITDLAELVHYDYYRPLINIYCERYGDVDIGALLDAAILGAAKKADIQSLNKLLGERQGERISIIGLLAGLTCNGHFELYNQILTDEKIKLKAHDVNFLMRRAAENFQQSFVEIYDNVSKNLAPTQFNLDEVTLSAATAFNRFYIKKLREELKSNFKEAIYLQGVAHGGDIAYITKYFDSNVVDKSELQQTLCGLISNGEHDDYVNRLISINNLSLIDYVFLAVNAAQEGNHEFAVALMVKSLARESTVAGRENVFMNYISNFCLNELHEVLNACYDHPQIKMFPLSDKDCLDLVKAMRIKNDKLKLHEFLSYLRDDGLRDAIFVGLAQIVPLVVFFTIDEANHIKELNRLIVANNCTYKKAGEIHVQQKAQKQLKAAAEAAKKAEETLKKMAEKREEIAKANQEKLAEKRRQEEEDAKKTSPANQLTELIVKVIEKDFGIVQTNKIDKEVQIQLSGAEAQISAFRNGLRTMPKNSGITISESLSKSLEIKSSIGSMQNLLTHTKFINQVKSFLQTSNAKVKKSAATPTKQNFLTGTQPTEIVLTPVQQQEWKTNLEKHLFCNATEMKVSIGSEKKEYIDKGVKKEHDQVVFTIELTAKDEWTIKPHKGTEKKCIKVEIGNETLEREITHASTYFKEHGLGKITVNKTATQLKIEPTTAALELGDLHESMFKALQPKAVKAKSPASLPTIAPTEDKKSQDEAEAAATTFVAEKESPLLAPSTANLRTVITNITGREHKQYLTIEEGKKNEQGKKNKWTLKFDLNASRTLNYPSAKQNERTIKSADLVTALSNSLNLGEGFNFVKKSEIKAGIFYITLDLQENNFAVLQNKAADIHNRFVKACDEQPEAIIKANESLDDAVERKRDNPFGLFNKSILRQETKLNIPPQTKKKVKKYIPLDLNDGAIQGNLPKECLQNYQYYLQQLGEIITSLAQEKDDLNTKVLLFAFFENVIELMKLLAAIYRADLGDKNKFYELRCLLRHNAESVDGWNFYQQLLPIIAALPAELSENLTISISKKHQDILAQLLEPHRAFLDNFKENKRPPSKKSLELLQFVINKLQALPIDDRKKLAAYFLMEFISKEPFLRDIINKFMHKDLSIPFDEKAFELLSGIEKIRAAEGGYTKSP